MKVTASLGVDDKFVRLLALHADNVADIFPNQIRAIQTLALMAQKRWIAHASGKPLPDGRTIHGRSGAYANSIQIKHDGELRYVIYSDDPKAHIIEHGARGWDMHKLLRTSHKVRIAEDGKRYLIFPFRHFTPTPEATVHEVAGDMMPTPIHQWWLARDRDTWTSLVTGTYEEPSVQDGETMVLRRRYHWGDRLTAGDIRDLGLDPEEEGRKYVGMVRFDSPTGRHGHYITFRTMTEDSPGWLQPERDAMNPAQAALDFAMEHAEGLLNRALDLDLRALKERVGE